MLKLLVTLVTILAVKGLTGLQASSYCHCDLTTAFCDFNCCCDLDCYSSASAIPSTCFHSKSHSYCPNPTFFARLGTSFLNAQGCFYYNSTGNLLDQVSLTAPQIATLINNQQSFTPLPTSSPSTPQGYQIGDALLIGGVSTFSFVAADGTCLTSTGTTTLSLKFGVNMRLHCNGATLTTTAPLIFSEFSGKTLGQFRADTTNTITIPSFSSTTITSAQIKIIIGTYGSSKGRYIERVTVSTASTVTTQRSLRIWFVEPSELLQPSQAPTFFPQLPSDIFYPIYLLS